MKVRKERGIEKQAKKGRREQKGKTGRAAKIKQ